MPITRSNLSDVERKDLADHAKKYKVYPYRYRINKTVNATNFTATDPGSVVNYFTMSFTATEVLPIISLATAVLVSPNTSVGVYGLALSYNPIYSLADNSTVGTPDEEGTVIYQIMSNGGAINDFQVFYPTNWYMERGSKIYLHVFADTTTVTTGTAKMYGHIVLGVMPTGV